MYADARSRRIALVSVGLVCVAGFSVPFAGLVPPRGIALLAPTMLFIIALAQLATGAVLLAFFAKAPRRSMAILAGAYFGTGFLAGLQALTLPSGRGVASVLRLTTEVAPWLYVAWHVGFCACAAAYFILRHHESDLRPRDLRRVVLSAVFGIVAAAVVVGEAIVANGDRLPRLIGDSEGSAFLASGVGPAVFAVCVLAAILAFAWRIPDEIDGALTVALVALSLDVGLHLVDDRRFVVAWYVARLLALVGASVVLVVSIRGLLGWRERAIRLESLLMEEKRIAERHACRLEMLWRLGSSTGDDETFLRQVLDAASSVIVEGQQLYGLISHLEAAEMVVDVASEIDHPEIARTGGRYPLDESILGAVLSEGKTSSWADIRSDSRFDVRRLQRVPWRAAIGTTFRVGETIYYVGFAGAEPLEAPFGALDHAFVETLASFCAARLHQRAQRDRLRYQTEHDPLTGALSRATFKARGFAALQESARTALAIVDVDRFRELNEAVGHVEADSVLVEIASALEGCASEREVVGRLGGDTFGILLGDAGSSDDVAARVERYAGVFERSFATIGVRGGHRLTASIGIAVAPDDGTTFERLLARADTAVYAAKDAGGARWLFFDRRFEDAFAQTRRLQNELAEALERGEFVLHFQPHVDFASGSMVGAEALIRWNHPRRGLIAPVEFVPFAEEHGMMGAIGSWVMAETVRASTAWRAHDEDFRVWFNMSATELADPALLDRLSALESTVRGVGVELTESVAMRDVHETMRNVAILREAGFAIALDDFGTGYSSLAHLKRLPIDVIKIDQAFTSGVPGDAHDEAIVGAVLEIANRFGFVAIAEGVENPAQVGWLAAAGCGFGQGYHFARPMPADAFDGWLRERRNSASGRAYMRA